MEGKIKNTGMARSTERTSQTSLCRVAVEHSAHSWHPPTRVPFSSFFFKKLFRSLIEKQVRHLVDLKCTLLTIPDKPSKTRPVCARARRHAKRCLKFSAFMGAKKKCCLKRCSLLVTILLTFHFPFSFSLLLFLVSDLQLTHKNDSVVLPVNVFFSAVTMSFPPFKRSK